VRIGLSSLSLLLLANAAPFSCHSGPSQRLSVAPYPTPSGSEAAKTLEPAGPSFPSTGSANSDAGAGSGGLTTAQVPPPAAPQAVQAPTVQFGGPVPMARGDAQRTGRSPYKIPQAAPKELWRFATQGAVVAAPTLASDGTILFTSHDRHVYAVDAAGALRWKHRTGDFVWSAAALLGGGLVLVGSDDDRLYALKLEDSSQAWSLSPGSCRRAVGRGPEAARCDIEDVTLGPDGTIYIGGDGVYAISADGKVRWRFVPEPDKDRKRHCSSAPSLGPGGAVYAVCSDQLYALNPDGTKRWQFEGPGEFDSAPAVGPDGTLYVGDEARRCLAIDPQGQLRFSFVSGGAVRAAPALRSDGIVLFGAYDGLLYALRPDGTLAWSFTTADAIHSAPLIDADGAVLFGSRDNRLYALGPDGRLRWSVVLDDDVDGAPSLGPDGTIYVGSDDRALHAFR
jgi:outer membrane protein assembly factor BamB